MNNINFAFCSLREHLINKVLTEQSVDDTVFVFPTESSRQIALMEFQTQWSFNRTLFLTMEELKDLLFLSSAPLLKEEKRTLAFFASLSAEDKDFFKINNYFQSIELAQHFFDLWEEFNEELADEHIDANKFSAYNAEFLDWQEKTFARLKAIKRKYQNFIERKGFNDVIFLYKLEHMNLFNFNDYKRFVIVNQFYYTRLEKEIIKKFTQAGKQVTIYYQLPEPLINKQDLTVKPFSLVDLKEYRTESIEIVESKNDFSMIVSLLERIHQHRIDQVIDVSFWKTPYANLLSAEKFKISAKESFTNSSLYRFLALLQSLTDNLIWEETGKNTLLPLQTLLDAVLCDDFCHYFIVAKDQREKKIIQEQTLHYLYRLIKNDYKFIDLNKSFFKLNPDETAQQVVQSIVSLIDQFIHVQSIEELIDFVGSSTGGICIENIVTDKLNLYSDIKEVFYQSLADFRSIKLLQLDDKWQYFFSSEPALTKAKTAAGLLKLFLNYVKFRSLRYTYEDVNSRRINITSLEDTRNIQYDKVAVLNVVERTIPSSPQILFLFTEKQRKILNLKSYEEVKQREKYYFFRLILNAKNVFLFTRKNIEQNVDVSSFVEEIRLYFPSDRMNEVEVEDKYYRQVYRQFLDSKNYSVSKEGTRSQDFFTIPLDAKKDFPMGNLDLTHSSWKELRDNSFAYFVSQIGRVEEKTKKVAMDFPPKFIGDISHDIIDEVWRQLIEYHNSPLFGYDFSAVDREFVDDIIGKIIKNESYYYRLPHNYTAAYFHEIMLPAIHEGVMDFFRFLEGLSLDKKNMVAIPEKKFPSLEEKKYKMFVLSEENELKLNVRILGRADLRIELPDKRYFIFDYKTGHFDENQLIIYELFYYILEKPELMENVSSYFFQILKRENKELKDFYNTGTKRVASKDEIFIRFKDEILQVLASISDYGFSLPTQKARLEKLPEITRKDLFLAVMSALEKKEPENSHS